MRCLKFKNQGNPVNQRKSHKGLTLIFGKSTEVAQGLILIADTTKNVKFSNISSFAMIHDYICQLSVQQTFIICSLT